MAAQSKRGISGIDLTDDEYTVEQSLIRNKYKALDAAGNVVLRGKQKLFKMKEQFPFTDDAGNEIFRVEAGGIVDIAGNYTLIDSETEEPVIVLDNDFSIFQDTWRVRDPDSEALLAEINSRGALVTLARHYVPLGALIPHKYEITDAEGNHVGNIEGQLSIRDRYEISIDDARDLPKEAIVAAAMVIDAIQGN
jgi:uncharacterized protein YxjI